MGVYEREGETHHGHCADYSRWKGARTVEVQSQENPRSKLQLEENPRRKTVGGGEPTKENYTQMEIGGGCARDCKNPIWKLHETWDR